MRGPVPSPDDIVGGQVIETPDEEDEDDNGDTGILLNDKDENNEKISSMLS